MCFPARFPVEKHIDGFCTRRQRHWFQGVKMGTTCGICIHMSQKFTAAGTCSERISSQNPTHNRMSCKMRSKDQIPSWQHTNGRKMAIIEIHQQRRMGEINFFHLCRIKVFGLTQNSVAPLKCTTRAIIGPSFQ